MIESVGAVSSAGRAHPLQGWGHWFEPSTAHHHVMIFFKQNVFKLNAFTFKTERFLSIFYYSDAAFDALVISN